MPRASAAMSSRGRLYRASQFALSRRKPGFESRGEAKKNNNLAGRRNFLGNFWVITVGGPPLPPPAGGAPGRQGQALPPLPGDGGNPEHVSISKLRRFVGRQRFSIAAAQTNV